LYNFRSICRRRQAQLGKFTTKLPSTTTTGATALATDQDYHDSVLTSSRNRRNGNPPLDFAVNPGLLLKRSRVSAGGSQSPTPPLLFQGEQLRLHQHNVDGGKTRGLGRDNASQTAGPDGSGLARNTRLVAAPALQRDYAAASGHQLYRCEPTSDWPGCRLAVGAVCCRLGLSKSVEPQLVGFAALPAHL
jgi:hypothetical protein